MTNREGLAGRLFAAMGVVERLEDDVLNVYVLHSGEPRMTNREGLAGRLFAAMGVVERLEDDVLNVLDEIFGPKGWSDFHVDPLDTSIEIFGPLEPRGQAVLREMGFKKAWIHPHDWRFEKRCTCPVTDLIGGIN